MCQNNKIKHHYGGHMKARKNTMFDPHCEVTDTESERALTVGVVGVKGVITASDA